MSSVWKGRKQAVKKPVPVKKWGDFRRTSPFSVDFGYDRGGPIDRFYIEKFLLKQAAHIKGRVLEIGDNKYTLAFGGPSVTQSDILHVDPANQEATITGDLSNLTGVAPDLFDCIILTQTLQYIFNCQQAIWHCHRILKPGGVLLLTVPAISNVDYGKSGESWLWSFSVASVAALLQSAFGNQPAQIETQGNFFSVRAFLYGLGMKDIEKQALEVPEKLFPLIISAMIQKQGEELL